MRVFCSICSVVMILILFYQTNFIVIYFGWTKNLLKIYDYLIALKEQNNSLAQPKFANYIEYLKFKYNSFIIELITCPFCLACWIALFFSLFNGIIFWPIIYVLSLLGYFCLLSLFKKSY